MREVSHCYYLMHRWSSWGPPVILRATELLWQVDCPLWLCHGKGSEYHLGFFEALSFLSKSAQ